MYIQTDFYIERDGKEIELLIGGEVYNSTPPKLFGHPDTWHAGDPGNCKVEEILLKQYQLSFWPDKNQKIYLIPWNGNLTSEEEKDAERELYHEYERELEYREEDAVLQRYGL